MELLNEECNLLTLLGEFISYLGTIVDFGCTFVRLLIFWFTCLSIMKLNHPNCESSCSDVTT